MKNDLKNGHRMSRTTRQQTTVYGIFIYLSFIYVFIHLFIYLCIYLFIYLLPDRSLHFIPFVLVIYHRKEVCRTFYIRT